MWSVEDRVLVQRYTGDNIAGLVDNLSVSEQVIEVEVRATIGYAGVVLWYQQVNNLTANFVSVSHNFQRGMWVIEARDGQGYLYEYGGPWIGSDTWYDLRVEADSVSGELVVSLVYPDGVYSFTHLAGTTNRSGLSGVYCGNEAAYFDNFRLTSYDIPNHPVPEPATMLLLATGLVGLAGFRRKFRRL